MDYPIKNEHCSFSHFLCTTDREAAATPLNRIWLRGAACLLIDYFFIRSAPAFQALPTLAPVA